MQGEVQGTGKPHPETGWNIMGSSAHILSTATLAIIYSTAEYWVTVWSASAHMKAIDVQLNTVMRIVSGKLKPTKTEWLPILCNIALPATQRNVLSS